MSHTIHDKKKMLNRIRRIRGQVEAIERALDQEQDCGEILRTVAACRGALNGLMFNILEGHVREHVLDPEEPVSPERADAAERLIEVVRTYLR